MLAGRKGGQQLRRRRGHPPHGLVERGVGAARRFLDAPHLAHVLPGGGFDLVRGGGRLEAAQRRDVAAHGPRLGAARLLTIRYDVTFSRASWARVTSSAACGATLSRASEIADWA